MNKHYAKLFTLSLFFTPVVLYFLGELIPFYGDTPDKIGFLHIFYVLASIGVYFFLTFFLGGCAFNPTEMEYMNIDEDTSPNYKPMKAVFAVILGIVLLTGLFTVFTNMKNLYNDSVTKHNVYDKKTEALKGFYDKLWKTYLTKEKIAGVNKATFIEVSKIIMENRKDGVNTTWKWVHENQNIPFNEFSRFYSDLSTYIENQREQYAALETERQDIANEYNTNLRTFPNNAYNLILNQKPIVYKYGFLSDSTNGVFAAGVENLK